MIRQSQRSLGSSGVAALLATVWLVCPACGPGDGGDRFASAIAAVAREVPSPNSAGISLSDLAATPIPRGSGVLVYAKNRKSRFAWVVLSEQPYACDRETKSLTPTVPSTSEARWDTWKQTGLDPANTAAFYRIVDEAEARMVTR